MKQAIGYTLLIVGSAGPRFRLPFVFTSLLYARFLDMVF